MESKYKFGLCSLFILLSVVLLNGCGRLTMYSIETEEAIVVSSPGERVDNTSIVYSRSENPTITGMILLPEPELTLRRLPDGTIDTCCSRSQVIADGNYFLDGGDSRFLSLTEPFDIWVTGGGVYTYSIPTLHLPSDGTPVKLSLEVNGEVKVTGYLQLAAEVIVLPVHVHILSQNGALPNEKLDQARVQRWFDYQSIETRAETIYNALAGISSTHLVTQPLPAPLLYASTDLIWQQANIQLKLESYDIVTVDEVLEEQVTTNILLGGLLTREIHARYRDIPGIHIYVGRNSSKDLVAGQTDPVPCSSESSLSALYAIALAWNVDNSNALAHEIGHFLGLNHTNARGACGSALLEDPTNPSGNLMVPTLGPRSNKLSSGQIARARSMACQWLVFWKIESSACSK